MMNTKCQDMCSEKASQEGLWRRSMSWLNSTSTECREERRCEVCPLSRVKAGVAVRIRQLCASPETQNRLRELGFCEDQIIRLLTSQANFICLVCNARL